MLGRFRVVQNFFIYSYALISSHSVVVQWQHLHPLPESLHIYIFERYSSLLEQCSVAPLRSICFHVDAVKLLWLGVGDSSLVFVWFVRCACACVCISTIVATASSGSGCQLSQKQVVISCAFDPSIKVKNIIYNFQCHFRNFFLLISIRFIFTFTQTIRLSFSCSLFSSTCSDRISSKQK